MDRRLRHRGVLLAPTAAASYADEILDRNPEAYWKMDEASGSLVDSTGHGYTAGQAGTVTTYTWGVAGPGGRAITVGPQFYFAEATLATGGTTHYCYVMTVRLEAASQSDRGLIGNWQGDGTMGYISAASDNALYIFHGGGGTTTGTSLTNGVWKHVMWGWDGSNLKCWVNGASVLNSSVGFGTAGRTGVSIGSYDGRNNSVIDGSLQHIAFYKGANADAILNDTEAGLLFAASGV
jgi:hypothetical protein